MDEVVFNIGLDFGTSQTKVCVQHTSANPRVHEFIQFPTPNGSPSFFLPTRIGIRADGTVSYGHLTPGDLKQTFDYFKIASAEDVHFRVESGLDRTHEYYDHGDYEPYTPELLSILYLTYVLLDVKRHIEETQGKAKRRSGLLGRLTKSMQTTLRYTVQLGLPTEYSSRTNLLRKRKFESILLIADCLGTYAGTSEKYAAFTINELQRLIGEFNREIVDRSSKEPGHRNEYLDGALNRAGLSVYPESAAGLTFLIRDRHISEGYYASLDIGGGSSDLSFFRVNESGRTSYLASESVLVAANNVYRAIAGGTNGYAQRTAEIEQRLRSHSVRDSETLLRDPTYRRAIKTVTGDLYRVIKRIFNGRVYQRFDRGAALVNRAIGEFKGQPCFVFGGGGSLPIPRQLNHIVIHDNGTPHVAEACTQMQRRPLQKDILSRAEYVRPNTPDLERDVALLAVAFGLSFPHYRDEALWDEHEYRRNMVDLERVPHPFNEDRYVYDVVHRKWV